MEDDDDVQVRLEDQTRINQFGRLNVKLHDLEDELKGKSSEHELLDDAANELILADDDEPIRCAPRLLSLPFFACMRSSFACTQEAVAASNAGLTTAGLSRAGTPLASATTK